MTPPRLDAADDAILGRTVGHYRIVEFLSRGGMGTVYRAEHDLIGKAAAVKVLRGDLSREPRMVQRFFNEAVAASAIRHPGIVEVFDFGQLPTGRAYIVMEFLDGETLACRLERCKRMPELTAAVIGRGIAVALAAAHDKGIIHRDLKPDNVFLVPDSELPGGERCKVLDFGIAKLMNRNLSDTSRTRTGTFMGTPLYMSPEQARGASDLDHRADLYSLGCLLYEMITGDPPFMADGAAEILAMQLYGEPVPPSERVPELSPAFEAVVLRLLAKEPEDRFQSATEVVAALTLALPELSERLSSAMTMPGLTPLVVPAQGSRPGGSRPRSPTSTLGGLAGPSGAPTHGPRPYLVMGMALLVAAGRVGMMRLRPRAVEARVEAAPPVAALPVAAEPPVAAPVPAEPAEIVFDLDLDPPSASIRVDGDVVDAADGRVRLPRDGREHVIGVSAPRYIPRRLTVRADRDQTLAVVLAPVPEPEVDEPPRRRPPPPPPERSVIRTPPPDASPGALIEERL
jgi:serine/threonine protein kinase